MFSKPFKEGRKVELRENWIIFSMIFYTTFSCENFKALVMIGLSVKPEIGMI